MKIHTVYISYLYLGIKVKQVPITFKFYSPPTRATSAQRIPVKELLLIVSFWKISRA